MDTLSTQDLRDRLPDVIARVRVAGESFLVTQYRRPAFIISPVPDGTPDAPYHAPSDGPYDGPTE